MGFAVTTRTFWRDRAPVRATLLRERGRGTKLDLGGWKRDLAVTGADSNSEEKRRILRGLADLTSGREAPAQLKEAFGQCVIG